MSIFETAKRWLYGVKERARAELNPQSIQDVTGGDYERYLIRASADLFEQALKSLKDEGEIWAFMRNGSRFSVAVIDRYPRIFDLEVVNPRTLGLSSRKIRGEAIALAGGEPLSEIKERIRLTLKQCMVFSDAFGSAPEPGGGD